MREAIDAGTMTSAPAVDRSPGFRQTAGQLFVVRLERLGWVDRDPTPHDLLRTPAIGRLRIELAEYVEVVVHDRKTTNGDREATVAQLEPIFDSLPSVGPLRQVFVVEQQRLPHAPRDTVIPTRHRRIGEKLARHRNWKARHVNV